MHFLWSWNISRDLFLIEMKFSPPQAKQSLTALHPLSESCWDRQTSLRNNESTDFTPEDELFRNQLPLSLTCQMAITLLACLKTWERCWLRLGSLCRSLLSVPEQVISPSSKPPRACCTWLSHRHIPGERAWQVRTERPDSDTLVSSRRCTCPFFSALSEV